MPYAPVVLHEFVVQRLVGSCGGSLEELVQALKGRDGGVGVLGQLQLIHTCPGPGVGGRSMGVSRAARGEGVRRAAADPQSTAGAAGEKGDLYCREDRVGRGRLHAKRQTNGPILAKSKPHQALSFNPPCVFGLDV